MRDLVLSGIRVLVVEDEAMIALDVKSILEEAGATVVGPARTLSAAKELAASGELAAALLDVQLGDTTVFPVARLLADRGIPFAFHTGRGDVGDLKATWFGADVIAKPATSAKIVAGVARLTRRN
jgi:DNA-binding response OmpR family regulator